MLCGNEMDKVGLSVGVLGCVVLGGVVRIVFEMERCGSIIIVD